MTWWARFLDWFKPAPRFASQVMPIEPFDAIGLARLHDVERLKVGLPRLLFATTLNVDAMARASHAAAVNLTAPHLHDGFKAVDYDDVRKGENAAMGQADSASVMAGWMASEGHRRNILDPKFSWIGCGRATSKDLVTYWYCVFAG